MLRPVLRKLRNILRAQYFPQLPRWRLARLRPARLNLQRRRLQFLHHMWHFLIPCSFWLYLACLPERLCGLEVYDTCHATFLQVCDRSTVELRMVTLWSKIVLLSISTLIIPNQYFQTYGMISELETKTSFYIYHAPFLNLYCPLHLATAWGLSLPWDYSTLITLCL